jgi:hypothetical protein
MNYAANALMTDQEFVAAFENSTLPLDSFHHADHVRMAFLYVCKYPILEAIPRFAASLVRFADAHGKPGLYHETITWAFLLLIHERLARAGCRQGWVEFAASNPDLLSWNTNILERHYREETLKSELARRIFVFPDKTSD